MASTHKGYAIVTGAGNGIGKETAFAFAEAGADGVIFADIDEQSAVKAAQESKALAMNSDYQGVAFKVDVADASAVQALVDEAMQKFGRIDYLVNSAGVEASKVAPFVDTPDDDFDRLYNVHAKGAYLLTKAIAKIMLGQEPGTITTKRYGTRTTSRGSIVHVASLMSAGAVPYKTPYVTAKHAMLGISRSASIDMAKAGVRVNVVSPTWVQSPLLETERSKIPQLDDIIKRFIPIGRVADADEVASAILYLSSPQSSYITGVNLYIDSGLSVGPSWV